MTVWRLDTENKRFGKASRQVETTVQLGGDITKRKAKKKCKSKGVEARAKNVWRKNIISQ